MALARIGAIGVPINTWLSEDEKKYVLEDAGATFIVSGSQWFAEASRLADRISWPITVMPAHAEGEEISTSSLCQGSPEAAPTASSNGDDSVATIIYTSGTTGYPKGVARTQRANTWNVVNSALGAPRTPEDVELFNLPSFGIGFLHFALPALIGGATLVLDGSFDAQRTWQLIQEHRVTRTFLAPTMIDSMLSIPGNEMFKIDSLQVIYTAYSFPERLRKKATARFGSRFVYMYGLTEAQLTCAAQTDFTVNPSSVGLSMGVSRIAVFDIDGHQLEANQTGEIAFEGPSTMRGYHRLPALTEEVSRGEWILTGDLGFLDAQGRLHYVGRTKEMIKTGGFSVDPVEVENAILSLEDVKEVTVVGIEDSHWGEAVIAFVSRMANTDLQAEIVIAACRSRIADYKAPKRVIFLDEMPKNPTGKVDRKSLRKLYADQPAVSP